MTYKYTRGACRQFLVEANRCGWVLARCVAPPAPGVFFGVDLLPTLTDRPNLCRPCGAGLVAAFYLAEALRAGRAGGVGGWEKRWQSHRTPKVLGGCGLGKKEILRRFAPLDDGQGRFGWLDGGLGEAERLARVIE